MATKRENDFLEMRRRRKSRWGGRKGGECVKTFAVEKRSVGNLMQGCVGIHFLVNAWCACVSLLSRIGMEQDAILVLLAREETHLTGLRTSH